MYVSVFSELLSPALEEDITGRVDEIAKDALGQGASGNRRNPPGFDGERDMGQTDDIFGTDGGDDKSDSNADDEEGGNMDEESEDGEMDDEGGESDEDLLNEDEDNEDSKETQDPIHKKNQLRDNMIQFYGILESNIQQIVEASTRINDVAVLDTCSKAANNLRDAKTYLFECINTRLETDDYEDLLRTYIALRRVYDVSVEMLSKHIGNMKVQLGVKGRRSKKK